MTNLSMLDRPVSVRPVRTRARKGTSKPDVALGKVAPAQISSTKISPTKISILVEILRRPDGASVQDLMAATGWQAHSVRGALSGSIKKTMGLAVISEKTDDGRRYRIASDVAKGVAG